MLTNKIFGRQKNWQLAITILVEILRSVKQEVQAATSKVMNAGSPQNQMHYLCLHYMAHCDWMTNIIDAKTIQWN